MFTIKKPVIAFVAIIFLSGFFPPQKKNKIKFIDPANMDLGVRPGDNFFLYANGGWLRKNPVPASKTRWGSFNQLIDENTKKLHRLLEDAAKNTGGDSKLQKVGDYYLSGLDSVRLEQLGYDPIKKDLQRINGLSSSKDIVGEMAYERINGIAGSPAAIYVGQDDKDATKYIPHIAQAGLTLPDRDYYLKDDARSVNVRNEFVSHVSRSFQLTGFSPSEGEAKADAVMRIETALAKAQLSRVEMRDVNKVYNKFSWKDLSLSTPFIDWKSLASAMKINGVDSIIVANPTYLKVFDVLLAAMQLSDWKSYLQWHVINEAAPYLSTAFLNEDFKFSHVITGQKEISPRWERISRQIDASLGDVLGELYVKKYFTPEAKKRMLDLVNNLQETFAERIRHISWMSDSTKQKALAKLSAFTKKIGYTDKWRDMSGIVIVKNDYIGNGQRAAQWAYLETVGRLGKPVDKTLWSMTPPTVNAYYNPSNNEITFPAGILQFPFFDFNADDAVNYGGIGCAIGHEMTHGFDDQGRLYGPGGDLADWWTKEDADKFNVRADSIAGQYNAFTLLDTLHVNGRLTLGENLADLGGVNIAYEAFTKTKQYHDGKKLDGFTPAQRFFLNYAQIWRSNILPEEASRRLLTDPHSPSTARVNEPLRNMDAWYDAFDVKENDKMYKPRDARIKIW